MRNGRKYLTREEILDQIDNLVQRKTFSLEIKGLTRETRDCLSQLLNGVLEKIGANPLASFHIFSGLMEALLNALKGNIRFVIFKDELYKKLIQKEKDEKETEHLLQVILDTSPLRDAMQRYIVPEKVKKTIQNILTLEEKIRVKKTELTDDEKELLSFIREKTQKDNLKISLKIEVTDDLLFIRIRNDAPIMSLDLKRIGESRQKHNELYKEGKSADFFRPEFLDEKESAGFGIAMIDEGYYNIGVDPLDHFTITTSSKATTVYLRYPIAALKADISF
ncbi:MAG: hypothetical protein L6Q54_11985 [Leptospiraceae bacterium]|nr:hypothetical protein [Leptospiraceae bacterium]MCK6381950.1 hypothetical protein [Leptospiraceae bacterium]NUM41823.1 hypothetical protein [Leptospiraceae bacterium]